MPGTIWAPIGRVGRAIRRRFHAPEHDQGGDEPAPAGASDSTPPLRAIIEALLPLGGQNLKAAGDIDSGGMGAIEAADDKNLQRRVAKKILHTDLQDSASMVASFIREAQVTAQLEHPHIVPVYDIARSEDGRVFFTMQKIEGNTLFQLIEKFHAAGGGDSEQLFDLIDVVVRVCDALGLAHSRGVVHRDIKPQNIMTGAFGEIYLMDWGIAQVDEAGDEAPGQAENAGKPASERRVSTTMVDVAGSGVVGTPAYMPPEQARAKTTDTRSDIFALGGIVYHIVTGREPYPGKNAAEALVHARACEFDPPSQVVGAATVIPPELERIILKAMSANPAQRYQDASALKVDLLRFMRGGGEFPRSSYAKGEHIVRENEEGDRAYVIVSGSCDVYKTIDGENKHLATLGPGKGFGETAVLASVRRTASVVCREDTVVMVVTGDSLEEEIERMKPWMGALIRTLVMQARSNLSRPAPSPCGPQPPSGGPPGTARPRAH